MFKAYLELWRTRFELLQGVNARAPKTLNENYAETVVTQKVISDYNELSCQGFFDKYAVTKKTYSRRVMEYGDPYINSPLAKLARKIYG